MSNLEENIAKRPRLNPVYSSLPFSNLLAQSTGHMKNHPILSDRKLIVHDLKGDKRWN
jgi:hypothetical protein